MGESATCLMRSYSQPSDVSQDINEGDPLRVLTESISFGRFMSESLAWEKRSVFSHNRHLEEVEKYSKPGSVAQKKAYFEAHYKKIAAAKKAAALLENSDTSINDVGVNNSGTELILSENTNGCNHVVEQFELEKGKSMNEEHDVENRKQLENDENKGKMAITQEDTILIKNPAEKSLDMKTKKMQAISSSKTLISSTKNKLPIPAKYATPVQPRNEISASPSVKKITRDFVDRKLSLSKSLNNESSITKSKLPFLSKIASPTQPKKDTNVNSSAKKSSRDSVEKKRPIPKSLHMSINQDSFLGISNKKQEVSSLKTSTKSKLPFLAKPASPAQPRKEINVSPIGKKPTRDYIEKKRTVPKSLHMSINLASQNEKSITKSPLIPQASKRISKDGSTPLPRPITDVKHCSVTPKSETRRSRTVVDHLNSGSKPAVGNRHSSLSLNCSKSSNVCENKSRTQTVSSPFSFQSDARAERRKEFYQKLEEKKNAVEAENAQMLQTKSKEKAENNSVQKLRQSFMLKINPVGHVNNTETSTPRNQRKITPKIGQKSTTSRITQDTNPRPPRTPSMAIAGSSDHARKNNEIASRSITSVTKKRTRENASPNVSG